MLSSYGSQSFRWSGGNDPHQLHLHWEFMGDTVHTNIIGNSGSLMPFIFWTTVCTCMDHVPCFSCFFLFRPCIFLLLFPVCSHGRSAGNRWMFSWEVRFWEEHHIASEASARMTSYKSSSLLFQEQRFQFFTPQYLSVPSSHTVLAQHGHQYCMSHQAKTQTQYHESMCLPTSTLVATDVASRWHNPQKVVYMKPYITNILGYQCHLLSIHCNLNHLRRSTCSQLSSSVALAHWPSILQQQKIYCTDIYIYIN